MGGGMTAVLNAANEEAVDAFLGGRISFLQIGDSVKEVIEQLKKHAESVTLEKILEADKEARECTLAWIGHHGKKG